MLRDSIQKMGQLLAACTLAALVVGCNEPQRTTSPSDETASPTVPRYTAASGFAGTQLGRATIAEGFKLNRTNGSWAFDIDAKNPTDVAVTSLTIQAGGHSGWHGHPGPVFLQVTAGTLTFYDSHDPLCKPVVKTVGQVFVESGASAHISRNETAAVATAIVTVFAPAGAPLRIDHQKPANCSF